MTRPGLEDAREELISKYGRWTAHNIHLGGGIYTIARGHVGAAELNIARIVQLVSDLAPQPLETLRILDLGAYECGFAIELAAQGADVTALEIREEHVAKGEFARRALGLENLTIRQQDVRDLDPSEIGEFDVVLCLGILYHLSATDAITLLQRVARCTRALAIVETQVSLSRRKKIEVEGFEYYGRLFGEAEGTPGSAVGISHSFWLTRPSLLRALVRAGFTTVTEVSLPFVPAILPFQDHLAVVAAKRGRRSVRAVESAPAADELWALPERWPRLATQGVKGRVRERIARARGGGLAAVFPRAPSSAGDEDA